MRDSALALQFVKKAVSEMETALAALGPANAFRPVVKLNLDLIASLAKQLKVDGAK